MKGRMLVCVAAVALMMLGLSGAAMAQPAQPGGNQGGNRGNRGNFDPAQMRERYMNDLKTRLGSNDDEWKVLSPKIEKVLNAQRASRGSRFGGRGGGRDTNTQDQTPVSKASAELRTAVEDKATSAEDLAKKMVAYREAREKARAEFQAAQKELKELLTARQEAVLLSSGLLD